jgi:hypothetical protein
MRALVFSFLICAASASAQVPASSNGLPPEIWIAGAGGVTANTCVSNDSSSPALIVAGTGSGCYGIALNTGADGSAVRVQRYGTAPCVADNAVIAGHLIISGTSTAMDCRDSGQTSSSAISIGTRIIGVALTSQATPGGTFQVELTPSHFGTSVLIGGSITGGTANNLLLSGSTLGQLAITTNDVPVSNSSGVIFSAENMINIQSFGGKPDGSTDNSTAISNAFTYAAAHPGTTIYFPSSGATGRFYSVKTPLSERWPSYTRLLGDSVDETQINWSPSSSQGTVPAILDATGAYAVEMEHLTVNGASSSFPTQVGILLERNGSNGSAGGHHFSYSNIEGYYVVAAVYSISSEGNDWHGTRIQSEATGVPALITSAVDSAGVCVASGSYTCQSGGQSNLSLFFEGGSAAIALAGDAIVDVVNNGTGDHVYRDSYFSAAGTGSSAIRLENITGVGSQITIEGNREENATYFVRFSSGGGNTYNNVHISNNTGSNYTGYCMYADTGTTVSASVIEGNNCNSATSSFDTLNNSQYTSTTEASVVSRTGGAGNLLISPGVNNVFSTFSTTSNILLQNGIASIPSAVLGTCTGCGGGSSATVQIGTTDLVCASGSDNTINGVTPAAFSQAASAVLSVSNTSNFFVGSNVTVSGIVQSGWNGNYQITALSSNSSITINLNSSSLTSVSGGTPLLSLTCGNSTDATPSYNTGFATSYTTPSGAFSVAGKQLQLDLGMNLYSPAVQGNTVQYFRMYGGSTALYTAGAGIVGVTATAGSGFTGSFRVTATAPAGSSVPLLVANTGPQIPGWTTASWPDVTAQNQSVNTTGPVTFAWKPGWVQSGAGGTITYSSGGTATGTGNCLATATTGSPAAVGLISASSGAISGTLSFGHAAQTTSGGNYTSAPTSWTLSAPTTGGATTCSGTITTTGGSLVGAQGNAIQLMSVTAHFNN